MPLRFLLFEGVFAYFCLLDNYNFKRTMDTILISVLFSVLVFLTLRQIAKNSCSIIPVEVNARLTPKLLVSAAVAVLSALAGGLYVPHYVFFCLTTLTVALYPLTSSVITYSWSRMITAVSISLEILAASVMMVLSLVFNIEVGEAVWVYLSVALSSAAVLVFLAGIFCHIADTANVMRTASVWNTVCLYVDTVYSLILLLFTVFLLIFNIYVMLLLQISLVVALCMRIRNSSEFVIMTDHERRIVESMRVSQTEYSGETPGTDQLYINIYERVLRYFDVHKPYLNSELTINDIVDVIYTNRMYISKAISHCTGRNFCQFVNYHRVAHAVELFRNNPHLKVVDLTNQCGFNSTTSFSSAFRLYMGEKPGDWCREERVRLSKK